MSDIVLLANSEDMRVVAAAAIQYTGADIPIVVTHTYEESQRLAMEYREKGCRICASDRRIRTCSGSLHGARIWG